MQLAKGMPWGRETTLPGILPLCGTATGRDHIEFPLVQIIAV